MMRQDDLLIELLTEELPPKALISLASAFCQLFTERLEKAELPFKTIHYYASPRRLALHVAGLDSQQQDQSIERKGPALSAAWDANGKPTPACMGFAKSCQTTPDQLITLKSAQGEWVGFTQHVTGQALPDLLPNLLQQTIAALPIPKRMRWGASDEQFVRPVHSLIVLYGEDIVPMTLLGCEAGRTTLGHRFLAPNAIVIPHASAYLTLLETEGYVMADIAKRRDTIKTEAAAVAAKTVGKDGTVIMSDALLDEVTGLVEWPVALCGHFDEPFLSVPKEVLISSMQDHQRYFPIVDTKGKLLPCFVFISNIISHEPERVIHGNERVLRARLADAAFFFQADKEHSLNSRLEKLQTVVYQAKLGTLHDKALRLQTLASSIANDIKADKTIAARAGLLAKADLISSMVGEFPELQGIMGCYYANHDGEPEAVAIAIQEHYLPKFSGDQLPATEGGMALAIADRLDTLAGAFGMGQLPTGDKDPYGLRRAALGILRICIERQIHLSLKTVLQLALNQYGDKVTNKEALSQLIAFCQDRLRAWYLEQGIAADVFAAVAALEIDDPYDLDQRLRAVQAFKLLSEADALSAANKRVSNILAKYTDPLTLSAVDPAHFEQPEEKALASQLDKVADKVKKLHTAKQYDQVLVTLAALRQPVDDFFDHVMVMAEDKVQRENRIILLTQLRALFLLVADVALLQ